MTPNERQATLIRLFGAVQAYDEDRHLFVVAPDRIGFGAVCAPMAGVDENTMNSINGLMTLGWPNGTLLQICHWAGPDIESFIHHFRVMRTGVDHPLLNEMTEQRVKQMRELTERPLSANATSRARQSVIILTVTIPVGAKQPSDDLMAQIADLRSGFMSQIKSMQMLPEALTASRYLRIMESIFNQGPEAAWRSTHVTEYDRTSLLCNQVLDGNTSIRREKNQLVFGEQTWVRTIHPKKFPARVHAGLAHRFLGETMKNGRVVSEPALLTLNVLYTDAEAGRASVGRDRAWAERNRRGPLAGLIPDWANQAESLRMTQEGLENGGRMIEAYLGAAVFASSKERVIAASNEMKGILTDLGFTAYIDHFVVLELFGQLLPFAADPAIKESLHRYHRLATTHAAYLAPVMGAWRGSGTPHMVMYGRDGNLMSWSPRDTDSNQNVIVVGGSGGGKSFMVSDLVFHTLCTGGRAFIVDKGYSYQPLAEALGTPYLEFHSDSDIKLNVFDQIRSWADEQDIVAGIIELMAAPKDGLSDRQRAALLEVLGELWDKHGRSLQIDNVAETLRSAQDQRISDIGHQLMPFTSKGAFGSYFNGQSNVDLESPLIVVELQSLTGRAHLMRVVLLAMLNHIQSAMDRLPVGMPKQIVVDEAWQLLSGKETKQFLTGWFRVLRKHGASALIASQGINDVLGDEGSQAIYENSAHIMMLMQKAESLELARRSGKLTLSEGEYRLMQTIRTVKGEYSEIFLRGPCGVGVGRLIVPRFNQLLYSTDPADKAERLAYMDRGLSVVDAVKAMLRDRDSRRIDAA